MRLAGFGMLLVTSALIAPCAHAQSESVPPNVIESQPSGRAGQSTSDRGKTEPSAENPGVSFVFGETPSTGDAQAIIPLAPRGDNSANNLPVDRAAPR